MIDLRLELKDLFETDEGGISRWIVVRHFTDEYSEYWKPETREAVGGPAYKFVDTPARTYSVQALPPTSLRSEGLIKEEPRMLEESIYKFYLEHSVIVDENDEIFELNYNGKIVPQMITGDTQEDLSQGKVKAKERYKVRKVEPLRCDDGREEYKMVFADKTIYR